MLAYKISRQDRRTIYVYPIDFFTLLLFIIIDKSCNVKSVPGIAEYNSLYNESKLARTID